MAKATAAGSESLAASAFAGSALAVSFLATGTGATGAGATGRAGVAGDAGFEGASEGLRSRPMAEPANSRQMRVGLRMNYT